MQIGKSDGEHFCFSCDTRGNWAVFFPKTRHTAAISFGFAWRPVGVTELRPFFSFYRIGQYPFARMWHLRRPYNVVRVGEWRRV
jgi:hypothetical protein